MLQNYYKTRIIKLKSILPRSIESMRQEKGGKDVFRSP